MFDDRRIGGNPGRITCFGAIGGYQQHFAAEAPNEQILAGQGDTQPSCRTYPDIILLKRAAVPVSDLSTAL
jgi:hypothetical protein